MRVGSISAMWHLGLCDWPTTGARCVIVSPIQSVDRVHRDVNVVDGFPVAIIDEVRNDRVRETAFEVSGLAHRRAG